MPSVTLISSGGQPVRARRTHVSTWTVIDVRPMRSVAAVTAHEVADVDGPVEAHRLDADGRDASTGAGHRVGPARDVHLREQPAAEDVAVRIGVGRHRGRYEARPRPRAVVAYRSCSHPSAPEVLRLRAMLRETGRPGKSGERFLPDSNVDMWPNVCMILFIVGKGCCQHESHSSHLRRSTARATRSTSPRFGNEAGRRGWWREAAAEYLKRQDAEDIARRYRAGYRDTSSLDDELEGWGGPRARGRTTDREASPGREIWQYRFGAPDKRRPVVILTRQEVLPPPPYCDGRTDHVDDSRAAERGDRRHRRRPEARLRHQPRSRSDRRATTPARLHRLVERREDAPGLSGAVSRHRLCMRRIAAEPVQRDPPRDELRTGTRSIEHERRAIHEPLRDGA